jgi:hypothetical protein
MIDHQNLDHLIAALELQAELGLDGFNQRD